MESMQPGLGCSETVKVGVEEGRGGSPTVSAARKRGGGVGGNPQAGGSALGPCFLPHIQPFSWARQQLSLSN